MYRKSLGNILTLMYFETLLKTMFSFGKFSTILSVWTRPGHVPRAARLSD